MYLIGLGNPGKKYQHNRHNAGSLFVDWVFAQSGTSASWHSDPRKQCYYQHITFEANPLTLVKPLTYMNMSGVAVNALFRFLHSKISPEILVVAHDDLDLPVGSWKLDFGKGPKNHNGLISLEESLGSSSFWRLRMGVDARDPAMRTAGEVYVLQDFSQKEYDMMSSQYPRMWDTVKERIPLKKS